MALFPRWPSCKAVDSVKGWRAAESCAVGSAGRSGRRREVPPSSALCGSGFVGVEAHSVVLPSDSAGASGTTSP